MATQDRELGCTAIVTTLPRTLRSPAKGPATGHNDVFRATNVGSYNKNKKTFSLTHRFNHGKL